MKKLFGSILIICLCFVGFAKADFLLNSFGTFGEGGSCDDCSGSVILTYHAENSLDTTSGTPCGCADNDEVATQSGSWTFSGTAYDGSYAMSFANNGESADFDEVIGTTVETGSICVRVRATWSGFTDSTEIFSAYIDAQNVIHVYGYGYDTGTVDFYFKYEGQDDLEQRNIANVPMTDDTWLAICASWDTDESAGSDTMWFWVDGDADGVVDAGEYSYSAAISQDVMTGGSIQLRFGPHGTVISGGADFLMEDVYVDGSLHTDAFSF